VPRFDLQGLSVTGILAKGFHLHVRHAHPAPEPFWALTGACVFTRQRLVRDRTRLALRALAFEAQVMHESNHMAAMKLCLTESVDHDGHALRGPHFAAKSIRHCAPEQLLYKLCSFCGAKT
jgi:hypothetical protein